MVIMRWKSVGHFLLNIWLVLAHIMGSWGSQSVVGRLQCRAKIEPTRNEWYALLRSCCDLLIKLHFGKQFPIYLNRLEFECLLLRLYLLPKTEARSSSINMHFKFRAVKRARCADFSELYLLRKLGVVVYMKAKDRRNCCQKVLFDRLQTRLDQIRIEQGLHPLYHRLHNIRPTRLPT